MKKIFFALATLLTVLSCQEDVQFNTPAFQGIKNGDFLWKASAYTVAIDGNGFLTFSGNNGFGDLTLQVPSASVGVYYFGDVPSMVATYQENASAYSTNNDGVGSVVYVSDGEINIEEIDYTENTFTGSFKFNAYTSSGQGVVNFSEGVFYKLPLTFGSIPMDVYTCADAQSATSAAQVLFNDTDLSNSVEYNERCSSYVAALQNQMTYCGDVSGDIQAIIDDLGDCSLPCEYAQDNTANALALYNAATIGNYIELCNNYSFYLGEQIQFCGDEDGAIQAIIDGLNCLDDDNDGVPNIFEDIDGDGDFDNDDTDLDGIPDYLDTDDDGDGILTSDEVTDADNNPVDSDSDNILDYLDMDDDGDSVYTIFETGDTDGDGTLDYLDTDDDGDGVLTIDENPDPNADGDPADAQDTDGDMIPDYLDDM